MMSLGEVAFISLWWSVWMCASRVCGTCHLFSTIFWATKTWVRSTAVRHSSWMQRNTVRVCWGRELNYGPFGMF